MKILAHLFHNPLAMAKAFPEPALAEIQGAIAAGELRHRGQVRLAVESHLPLLAMLGKQTIRQRAIRAFTRLGMHATQERTGVLIYLCMAGRHIEIVADTGAAEKISPVEWERILSATAGFFSRGDFKSGALLVIGDTHDLLTRHFPAIGAPRDELSDKVAVI